MGSLERVLVLDENESNVLFFEMLLQQLDRNLTVYTSSVGAQAEMVVKEEKIQFIICAWEMNSMPGTVFVQRIKNNRNKKHIPCLIFSKRMTDEDVTLTKELGFQDVLGMPFDKEKARETILRIIESEEHVTSEEKKLRKIEALIGEGDLKEALKLFDNKLTSGKNKSRALIALAEIWLQTKNFEKAEQVLGEILDEEPDCTNALRLKAKLYSLTNRHDEAIVALEMMIQKSPKNIKSLLCLGSVYVDANQLDKAKGVFDKVEKIDSENSQLNDEKGKMAFKEGDIPLAAQLLAETEAGEELARHFNNLAIAKVASEQFDEGIQTYKNAIQLLSDKAKLHQLHYNLGLAWKKKGDMEQGFILLCQSYLIDPSFEKAYIALARVSKELKAEGKKLDAKLVNKVKIARQKYKGKLDNAS